MLMVDWIEVDKVTRVVTIAWALWHNRNEIRHGGVRNIRNALVNWATHYLEEYKAAVKESCIENKVGELVLASTNQTSVFTLIII